MISEARLLRKISLRLIPFMFLMYIVAYLDRVNVSFAALQMNAALGFSATVLSGANSSPAPVYQVPLITVA